MIESITVSNPSPADQGNFICPLDYALLGDLNYVLDRTTPIEAPVTPTISVENVVAEAIANLGLAHVSPVASP